MKFCPKCGNELNDNQLNFCPKCGAPLPKNDVGNAVSEEQPEPVKQPQRTTKNKGVKIVLIALILVFACGAGYFAFNKYQEDQQEKERIAQEQAVAEQKEKEEQEKKEQEEKEKDEVKNSLASKSNVKDTLIFGMNDGKHLQYAEIIGMDVEQVKEVYDMDVIKDLNVDDNKKVQAFSIYFDEPFNSETLLRTVDHYPYMTWNKEKGFFTETGLISKTGEKLQILYFVDQTRLSIDRAVIVGINQSQRSLENNGGELSDCLYYDPKDDITHFSGGFVIRGNHCY